MTNNTDENGLLINKAQEILRKTYKEINKIKQDLSELIMDFDSTITFSEEYSYGGKYLALKSNHTFLYKQDLDESQQSNGNFSQRIFATVVILNDDDNSLKRINLKDQPEIWFISISVVNREENIRPWHVSEILTKEHNIKGKLEANGKFFVYKWTDENKDLNDEELEKWEGRIIGFPLINVVDKVFIKNEIIDKLMVKE